MPRQAARLAAAPASVSFVSSRVFALANVLAGASRYRYLAASADLWKLHQRVGKRNRRAPDVCFRPKADISEFPQWLLAPHQPLVSTYCGHNARFTMSARHREAYARFGRIANNAARKVQAQLALAHFPSSRRLLSSRRSVPKATTAV